MPFHCSTLVFINPDLIAEGIEKFFNENKIKEIFSVSVFTTAVQINPAGSLHIAGSQQPQVQYQFRFVLTYSL